MIRRTPKLNNKTPILITILFITIVISISSIVIVINNKKKEKFNYTFTEMVKTAYQIDPSILEFDENNKALLKVDTLIKGVKNKSSSITHDGELFTKDFDQCVGYFIVTKTGKSIDVDLSHICDTIDY